MVPIYDSPDGPVNIRQAHDLWTRNKLLVFDFKNRRVDVGLNGISSDKYQTTDKARYLKELAIYDDWLKKQNNLGRKGVSFSEIQIFKAVRSPKSFINLQSKVDALLPDTYLNVSGLTASGAGSRVVKTIKNVFWAPGLPIVSNNLQNYLTALSLLTGNHDAARSLAFEYFGEKETQTVVNTGTQLIRMPNLNIKPQKSYPQFSYAQRKKLPVIPVETDSTLISIADVGLTAVPKRFIHPPMNIPNTTISSAKQANDVEIDMYQTNQQKLMAAI